ncbi:hypothetical protein QJS10_CPB21g00441 [Acorus calamus]|uniref:SLH domain-containing protein n=1 Tax=Acorus calamus TaxID=4465 RepID=A0AAV9C562_ACOCL|nr:hypothetical protein QJS10_CPB21g00441 [Acorus calamus]
MACLTITSSPNAIRLKLGPEFRKSSSVHLRMRFRTSERRSLAVYASSAAKGDDGNGESWTNSDKSSDPFAGWVGADSGEGSSWKPGFTGVMGAGVAAVIFAVGVAFASFSFRSRNTSGIKQHMEPLTSQQEVLLSSDDLNGNEDQVKNEFSEVTLDKESLENDLKTEYTTDCTDLDVLDNAASQEDLQISPDVDDHVTPTSSYPSSTGLLESHAVDGSSDASTFEDPHSNSPDHFESSVYTDSTSGISTHSVPADVDNPEVQLDSSNDSGSQLHIEPMASSNSLPLKSDEIINSQVDSRDVPEIVTSNTSSQVDLAEEMQSPFNDSSFTLEEHNQMENSSSGTTSGSLYDQIKAPELSSETYDSFPEGDKPNENGQSAETTSIFELPHENIPDTSPDSEISRPLFESPVPEHSLPYAGKPAPSLVSAALQASPGEILVPAVIDQVQGQAFAALQVLKVIESDARPGDICTRREYARWLVSASGALSRNTISKVYPAMYIEKVTELAFDDITPEDPDFASIQGLAEAGLIQSRLSGYDANGSLDGELDSIRFFPESPLSRQDLVSWKMALEKSLLAEVDKKTLYQCSGFIDIDRINPDAWPALVADLSAGEQGITSLAFGYTRLFQPNKPVTKAQAAIALATGDAAEVVGEELTRIEAESMAETAVAAHTALVAQVENDLNASFEEELAREREKVDAVEKLAEEARLELEKLRAEREEENNTLLRGRAAVDSETEVLARLRGEMEEQLQSLISNKMEISYERERINKLRQEAETENQAIVKLQYELEVERKALSMARTWAEEEALRAREQAKELEEARERWERRGIKVVVDSDLRDDANIGTPWLNAGKPSLVDGTVNRAENLVSNLRAIVAETKGRSVAVMETIIHAGKPSLVDGTINRAENLVTKLRTMAAETKGRSLAVIETAIQHINLFVSALKQRASDAATRATGRARELQSVVVLKANESAEEFRRNAASFGSSVKDGATRAAGDCRESLERITQKFKT